MSDMQKPTSKSVEELVGVYTWMKFQNHERTFIIGTAAVKGESVVVKGNPGATVLERGCTYRFFGRWQNDPKWGKQFAFTSAVKDAPHDEAGVLRYLCREAPGIAAGRAQLLWEEFGADAVKVLTETPMLAVEKGILTEVVALNASRHLSAICGAVDTTIDLYSLFNGRGFPSKLVDAVLNEWGSAAAERIRENPFILMTKGFSGCGFRRVDRLYIDLKKDPAAPERQMLAAWYAIHSDTNGNTWHRVGKAMDGVTELIGGAKASPAQAILEGVERKMLRLWGDGHNVADRVGWVAIEKMAAAEECLAEQIKRLMAVHHPYWPKLVGVPEGGVGVTLHQAEQFGIGSTRPVAVLVGTPGTGKTYVAAAVVAALLEEKGSRRLALCAPTGKAAVRFTESMAKYGIDRRATTIHSLLKVGVGDNGEWKFQYDGTNKAPYDVFVIDEVSMLDVPLAASLFSAVPTGAHVLLLGDKYQLPPVGHGAPLRDLMAAGLPCGELTEIKRNAGNIVRSCAAMKDGKSILPFATDKYGKDAGENLIHIHCQEAEDTISRLLWFMDRLAVSKHQFDIMEDVQVIVAVNAKSPLSRSAINKLLQAKLNPGGKSIADNPYRVGDKVIALKNAMSVCLELKDGAPDPTESGAYCSIREFNDVKGEFGDKVRFVANGEIGRCIAIGPKVAIARFQGAEERIIRIPCGFVRERKEGDEGENEEVESSSFDLAYAITGHKSQGSEWRVVIGLIDAYPGARFVCSREWWYTMDSRGRDLTILLGDMAILDGHCRRVSLAERKTFLAKLLEGYDAIEIEPAAAPTRSLVPAAHPDRQAGEGAVPVPGTADGPDRRAPAHKRANPKNTPKARGLHNPGARPPAARRKKNG